MRTDGDNRRDTGAPGSMSPIAITTRGTVSAVATQKRRVMSRNSALSPDVPVAITGSSAMPQMGQLPGPICRTWGCIGQVNATSWSAAVTESLTGLDGGTAL